MPNRLSRCKPTVRSIPWVFTHNKLLKAWLVCLGVDFPKSHDLTELVALLPEKHLFPLSAEECVGLTDYATVTRYPGEWEPLDRADAEEAVEWAKKVKAVVRQILRV